MEFHEKLQQLRRQKNMTQEQLAQQLFVSRTAVSKWESGRGYPNLDSLKSISKLFSVSIDELLSNDELIDLAQTENHSGIHRVIGMVFGILDLITAVFFFLPLVGVQDGNTVRAIALLEQGSVTGFLRGIYFAALITVSLFGLFELFLEFADNEKGLRLCRPCSIALYAGLILLFALSRQPYLTVFVFLLFMVKVALLMKSP